MAINKGQDFIEVVLRADPTSSVDKISDSFPAIEAGLKKKDAIEIVLKASIGASVDAIALNFPAIQGELRRKGLSIHVPIKISNLNSADLKRELTAIQNTIHSSPTEMDIKLNNSQAVSQIELLKKEIEKIQKESVVPTNDKGWRAFKATWNDVKELGKEARKEVNAAAKELSLTGGKNIDKNDTSKVMNTAAGKYEAIKRLTEQTYIIENNEVETLKEKLRLIKMIEAANAELPRLGVDDVSNKFNGKTVDLENMKSDTISRLTEIENSSPDKQSRIDAIQMEINKIEEEAKAYEQLKLKEIEALNVSVANTEANPPVEVQEEVASKVDTKQTEKTTKAVLNEGQATDALTKQVNETVASKQAFIDISRQQETQIEQDNISIDAETEAMERLKLEILATVKAKKSLINTGDKKTDNVLPPAPEPDEVKPVPKRKGRPPKSKSIDNTQSKHLEVTPIEGATKAFKLETVVDKEEVKQEITQAVNEAKKTPAAKVELAVDDKKLKKEVDKAVKAALKDAKKTAKEEKISPKIVVSENIEDIEAFTQMNEVSRDIAKKKNKGMTLSKIEAYKDDAGALVGGTLTYENASRTEAIKETYGLKEANDELGESFDDIEQDVEKFQKTSTKYTKNLKKETEAVEKLTKAEIENQKKNKTAAHSQKSSLDNGFKSIGVDSIKDDNKQLSNLYEEINQDINNLASSRAKDTKIEEQEIKNKINDYKRLAREMKKAQKPKNDLTEGGLNKEQKKKFNSKLGEYNKYKEEYETVYVKVEADKGSLTKSKKVILNAIGTLKEKLDDVEKIKVAVEIKDVDKIDLIEKKLREVKVAEQNLTQVLKDQTDKRVSERTSEIATLKRQITNYALANNRLNSNAEFKDSIKTLLSKVDGLDPSDNEGAAKLKSEFNQLTNNIKAAGLEAGTLGQRFKTLFSRHSAIAVTMIGINAAKRAMRAMYDAVVAVDTAMTSLKKVTSESDAVYNKFLDTATVKAKVLGTTISDVVESTAEFSRLGFNLAEATELAEAAILYKNVGDGINDIADSSKSIISTMKAFNIAATDSISIVDKFNEVGNNFPIASKGIGDAFMRSASSLAAAGNSIDESIGLIVAANEIVQDPEVVGTALKTVSMRLRNANGALEKLGEDSDGAAESITKLQAQLKTLTNGQVDIMLDETTFKSTYDIMVELSKVWGNLNDIQQAEIIRLVAGVRQGNVFTAVMTSMDNGVKATTTSLNAQGSALKENQTYLDSINGRVSVLQANFQELAIKTIESELVKSLVDLVSGILAVINQIGGLNAILIVTSGILGARMSSAILEICGSLIGRFVPDLAKASLAVKALSTALTFMIPVAILIAGIAILDHFYITLEEHQAKLTELQSEYEEITTNLEKYNSELKTTVDRMKELEKFGVQDDERKEYNDLVEQNKELERKVELEKALEKLKKVETNDEAIATISSESEDQIVTQRNAVAKSVKVDRVEGVKQRISAYKELTNTIADLENKQISLAKNSEGDSDQAKANRKSMAANAKLIEKNKKLQGEYTSYISNTTDELNSEKEGLDLNSTSGKALYKEIEVLNDEVLDFTGTLNNNTEALDENSDSAIVSAQDALANSYREGKITLAEYITQLNALKKSSREYEAEAYDLALANEYLTSVSEKVANADSFTKEEIDKLVEFYPALKDAIMETADGWTIEKSAVDLLNESVVLLQTAYLNAQNAMTELAAIEAGKRLGITDAELAGIQSVADAYNLLAGHKDPNNGTFYTEKELKLWNEINDPTITNTLALGRSRETIAALQAELGKINTSSLGADSSSSDDPLIKAFDKAYKELEYQRDKGLINEEQFYKAVEALNIQYFKGKIKYLDNYREHEIEVLEGLRTVYEGYYDKQLENSKQWIEDRNFYNDWGADNEVLAWQRVKAYTERFYAEGKISHERYVQEISEINKNIFNAQKANEEKVKSAQDLLIDYWEKYYDLQKEAEDERHDNVIKNIDKEIDKLKEKYALEDYNKDIADKDKAILKKQAEINALALDTSTEGNARRFALQEELDALLLDKDEAVENQKRENAEETLDDLKDAEDERYDYTKDILDKASSEVALFNKTQADLANMTTEQIIDAYNKMGAAIGGAYASAAKQAELFNAVAGAKSATTPATDGGAPATNYVLVNPDWTTPSYAKTGDIIVTGGGLFRKNATGAGTWIQDLSTGKTSVYADVVAEYKRLTAYKNGGEIDTTGIFWGDGTKSKPEYVLDNSDFVSLLKVIDVSKSLIPDLKTLYTPITPNNNNSSVINSNIYVYAVPNENVDSLIGRIKKEVWSDLDNKMGLVGIRR